MDAALGNPVQQRATHSRIALVLGVPCIAILAAQVFLIWRINVNWDEFMFLTQVHQLLRGELAQTFQVAFTHLFTWLPVVGDEMAQIITARGIMFVLFAVSAVLVGKLASRWASPAGSLIAVLCFLSTSYVLRHGASFRSDSLLLPLLLGALVLVTRPRPSRRSDVLAGVLFGLSFVVSIKTVLFLPVLAVFAIASTPSVGAGLALRLRGLVARWIVPALAAIVASGAILSWHALTLPAQSDLSASAFVTTVAGKTLLEIPWFARWPYFRVTLDADLASWILIGIGALAAVVRRKWTVAACALALLPIAVYRNAFPYFYVVMLAPAAVLAAVAADEIRAYAGRRAGASKPDWLWLVIALPLALQAFVHIERLATDKQWPQRKTVSAVHQIFPDPVPYLDHSGMIASFRKVNFFMSTWGMETYWARGTGFMRDVLREQRPPLLVANRGEIDPRSSSFSWLLAEDRALIEQFYLPYWGPIWVAGASVDVPPEGAVRMAVPFPGRYRIVTSQPVAIDGVTRVSGDVVEIREEDCTVAAPKDAVPGAAFPVVLFWAAARAPPHEPADFYPVYVGL